MNLNSAEVLKDFDNFLMAVLIDLYARREVKFIIDITGKDEKIDSAKDLDGVAAMVFFILNTIASLTEESIAEHVMIITNAELNDQER